VAIAIPLYTAFATTGDSAIAAAYASGGVARTTQNPGAVVVSNTAGGSPTFTFTIQGSADGTNFFPIGYALVATPTTFVQSAITTTSTSTVTYLLQPGIPWNFLKLNISANTNETVTATAYL
jgi:hypothetical protein